jgi:Tfp pilus assembly protein PilF
VDGGSVGAILVIARSGVWLGVTFLAFILGALSKETVIVLPLVFFAYDLCQGYACGQGLWRQVGRCLWRGKFFYLPFFTAALVALGYYLVYVAPILKWQEWGPLTTLATVSRIWMYYLKLLLFPLTLNADYSGFFLLSTSFLEGLTVVATLGVVVLVLAVLWGLRRGYGLPAFCGLWFMLLLLPVSQILPHPEIAAEHYLYIPSFGFCLLVALFLARLTEGLGSRAQSLESRVRSGEKRPWSLALSPWPSGWEGWGVIAGYGLLAALVIFYGVRTVVRNQDWQDDLALWTKTVVTAPGSARAHHNLGVTRQIEGDWAGAWREFRQALDIDPTYGRSYTGMAEVSLAWLKVREALGYGGRAVELRPQDPRAHMTLGTIYFRLGNNKKALYHFRKVVELRPDFLSVYSALVTVYHAIGDEEGVKEWQGRLAEKGGSQIPAGILPGR